MKKFKLIYLALALPMMTSAQYKSEVWSPDNGDGTFTVKINISDDPDFVDALDARHLLITGDRFTPLKLYFK